MRNWRRFWGLLAGLAAVATLLLLWLDWSLRPLVREYAINRANIAASEALAAAVGSVLGDTAAYNNLTVVQRDEEGAVLSVQADAAEINRMSADVLTAVGNVLAKKELSTVQFPLFNATGRVLLMGRGPKITAILQQNGAAGVQVQSSFSEAGINQTLHRLELIVTFRAVVMAVGLHEPIETTGTFLVTETVIVGTVPDRYADISGK